MASPEQQLAELQQQIEQLKKQQESLVPGSKAHEAVTRATAAVAAAALTLQQAQRAYVAPTSVDLDARWRESLMRHGVPTQASYLRPAVYGQAFSAQPQPPLYSSRPLPAPQQPPPPLAAPSPQQQPSGPAPPPQFFKNPPPPQLPPPPPPASSQPAPPRTSGAAQAEDEAGGERGGSRRKHVGRGYTGPVEDGFSSREDEAEKEKRVATEAEEFREWHAKTQLPAASVLWALNLPD